MLAKVAELERVAVAEAVLVTAAVRVAAPSRVAVASAVFVTEAARSAVAVNEASATAIFVAVDETLADEDSVAVAGVTLTPLPLIVADAAVRVAAAGLMILVVEDIEAEEDSVAEAEKVWPILVAVAEILAEELSPAVTTLRP